MNLLSRTYYCILLSYFGYSFRFGGFLRRALPVNNRRCSKHLNLRFWLSEEFCLQVFLSQVRTFRTSNHLAKNRINWSRAHPNSQTIPCSYWAPLISWEFHGTRAPILQTGKVLRHLGCRLGDDLAILLAIELCKHASPAQPRSRWFWDDIKIVWLVVLWFLGEMFVGVFGGIKCCFWQQASKKQKRKHKNNNTNKTKQKQKQSDNNNHNNNKNNNNKNNKNKNKNNDNINITCSCDAHTIPFIFEWLSVLMKA